MGTQISHTLFQIFVKCDNVTRLENIQLRSRITTKSLHFCSPESKPVRFSHSLCAILVECKYRYVTTFRKSIKNVL